MSAKTTPTQAPEVPEAQEAPAKTPKVTARDQGIPEVYLSEAGTFRPGDDAKLKSDLITAVLGDGRLHVWDPEEALAVLEARGWMTMLETSRQARERKSQA
jgi:hypothetical protein